MSALPAPGGADPRPDDVIVELDRIGQRWSVLPVARAEAAQPLVRAALSALVGLAGDLTATPPPDLGLSVVVDQLRVLAYDACVAALGHEDPQRRARGIHEIYAILTTLRRSLP